MPVIINPFKGTDPTAQAISDVGNAIFGNTGAGELRKQQIIAAQRGNTEIDNFGRAVAANPNGAQGVISTPIGQAMLFASGRQPKEAADLALAGAANAYGGASRQAQNAQIGAGEGYGNTADMENAKLAENARQFNQKPQPAIDSNGNFAFATQGNTQGFTPIVNDSDVKGTKLNQNWGNLSPDEQAQAMGAAKGGGNQTPRNYISSPSGSDTGGQRFITYDGITDAATGQRLPPGFLAPTGVSVKDAGLDNPTNANKTAINSQIMGLNNFEGLADTMIGLTDTHPEAFGAYGSIAGGVQEIAQAANVLVDQMGGKQAYDSMLDQAQGALKSQGASPDILAHYNKAIGAVHTLGPLLAFQAASAFAQQTGRSVSNDEYNDVFLPMVGDPQGLLSSAAQVKTKMQILKAVVVFGRQMAQDYLDKGLAVPDGLASMAMAKAVASIANDSGTSLAAPVTAPAGGQPAPAGPPAVGTVDSGYQFVGGDPANPASWKKVQ